MQYSNFIYSCGIAILLSACGGDGKSPSSSSSSVSSLSSSLSSVSPSSSSSHSAMAPTSLNDKLISQTIERITSTLPSGTHREAGELKVYYGANAMFIGDGLFLNTSTVAGTYSVVYDAAQQKIQVTSQLQEPVAVTIVDSYTFASASEGEWLQSYDNGRVVVEGRFSIQDREYPGLAPLSLIGRKASLTFLKTSTQLPSGTYIDGGTAFHLYPTSSHFTTDLSNYGLPAGEGTYVYDRPALNVGRDTGFNSSFNAPYQIHYTFTTLTSGTFRENWNSGQILWEGTFVINDIE